MTRTFRTARSFVLLFALAISVASQDAPPGYETIEFDGFVATFDPNQEHVILEGDLDCSRFGGASNVGVTETSGRVGDADYVLFLPTEWNGDLVLFTHDYIPVEWAPAGRFWFPLPFGFAAETSEMPFAVARDIAVCQGFAWAASAYAGHGEAVAEGIRDTHLLLPTTRRHLDTAPAATFLMGYGLGGLVAVALAETYPHRYDGAVTLYGRIGGATLDQSRFGHVRVLFDVFFPDLIDPFTVDERAMTQPELMAFHQALQARIQADPSALQRMASVHLPGSELLDPAGVGLPLFAPNPRAPDAMAAFGSLAQGLMGAMTAWFIFIDDLRDRGDGLVFDNHQTVYSGADWTAEDEAALNERVARIEASQAAVRYWTTYYQPSGELRIPLLSLRPSWDYNGGIIHVWAYGQAVEGAGAQDSYTSWLIDDIGPREAAEALRALVEWAETGVRPAQPTVP